MTALQDKKVRLLSSLELSSHALRRKRTRTMIQLGGLLEKSGILEKFHITLGDDLQMEPGENVPMLFGALLEIKELIETDEHSRALWKQKGLQELGKKDND